MLGARYHNKHAVKIYISLLLLCMWSAVTMDISRLLLFQLKLYKKKNASSLTSFPLKPGPPGIPWSPLFPVGPWSPGDPMEPLSPWYPRGPFLPECPVDPDSPGGPGIPGGPCTPLEPWGEGGKQQQIQFIITFFSLQKKLNSECN